MQKSIGLAVLGVLFLISLIACSGGGGGGGTGGGTSYILQVSGQPAGARVYLNGNLVNNPNRIELPPGTHQIRVEVDLENGQAIFQTFTVVAGRDTAITYDLRRYRIVANPASVEVWVSQSVAVSATLYENDSQVSADFTWSSQNPNIATVDNSGRVVGRSMGTTKIIITDTRTKLSLEVPVTVLDFPPPPGG